MEQIVIFEVFRICELCWVFQVISPCIPHWGVPRAKVRKELSSSATEERLYYLVGQWVRTGLVLPSFEQRDDGASRRGCWGLQDAQSYATPLILC